MQQEQVYTEYSSCVCVCSLLYILSNVWVHTVYTAFTATDFVSSEDNFKESELWQFTQKNNKMFTIVKVISSWHVNVTESVSRCVQVLMGQEAI